jgi:hypothetical protein
MHYGRTGTISASVGVGYPDRLSMLCSAQKVWSVPLLPYDPELVARPFGSISGHQVLGLSPNPNGMEMQGFVQQVQTILCCPIYSGTWKEEVRQRAFTDFIAARRLQARWRATSQRKSYKRYKAARCLQSTWRGALHRDVYRKYLTACNTGLEDTLPQPQCRKHGGRNSTGV